MAGNGFAGIEDPTALNFTTGAATDAIAPTITNVTSPTANGRYKVGDVIAIQILFSEAVLVTGIPTLILETGTSDRVINYTSGSGTNTLTFTYTVRGGESSSDLEYLTANALSLNGGTIKDLAGNNANITLPAPGVTGSLSANKDLVIDSDITPPNIPVITSPAQTSDTTPAIIGTAEPGSQVSVSIDVNGDGTPDVTYETPVDEQGNWSLDLETATPTSGQKPVLVAGSQIGLSATATDAAGNVSDAATQTLLIALLAVDDFLSTSSDGSTIIDVLGNDSSAGAFSITGVTQPSQGTVIIDNNGTPNDPSDDRLVYTPNPQNNPSTLQRSGQNNLFRLFGNAQPFTDSFTYTIADANGNSDTATVNVNVEPTFRLKFTLSDNNANFVNEIGIFTVDDDLGTIDGIAPGEEGYLEAALSSGRVIFSSLSENLFDLNSERIIEGFRSAIALAFSWCKIVR
ncbi:MAG: hypothetical protein HC820_05950 [Hydrococcus sp. RM1_1_31]|nr:hypothetical protein [Hydrococcus sp. RM1_1_31]